jgi:RND family efflux transporter MFP subunit
VLAIAAGTWLWNHYQREPWTRNGRLRADVAKVAPDVSGQVTSVNVQDNQPVTKGQVLFVIDTERYTLALRQAEAIVASHRAMLEQARREAGRSRQLSGLVVSQQEREQARARVQQAEAALAQAEAQLDIARLNLERASVKAPVNGTVTNLELKPGDYISAGRQALALVDSDSFHVEGYFEETKLARIHIGDPVSIQLMGERQPLRGHVESIATGIEDRDRVSGPNLLPNVNPTFSWVRLAQRVPVRIALEHVPPGTQLVAGRTATVRIGHRPPPRPNTPVEARR